MSELSRWQLVHCQVRNLGKESRGVPVPVASGDQELLPSHPQIGVMAEVLFS